MRYMKNLSNISLTLSHLSQETQGELRLSQGIEHLHLMDWQADCQHWLWLFFSISPSCLLVENFQLNVYMMQLNYIALTVQDLFKDSPTSSEKFYSQTPGNNTPWFYLPVILSFSESQNCQISRAGRAPSSGSLVNVAAS